jgi:hypothetical protein
MNFTHYKKILTLSKGFIDVSFQRLTGMMKISLSNAKK